MENNELYISDVKKNIGWVYSDLKWLTEKEAELANKERDGLLKSLSNKVSYSFMQSKIHIGKLSPGCLICGEGHWSCMFINGLCTAHCFYCPQDRKIKEERPPLEEIGFDGPEDYAVYLKKFNFKGVGFSGGETLLVFDKLLTYIKKIREKFGKYIYLWIYTNGDLINKDKIKRLKNAGLDEIRFNISARDYGLGCLELAINSINTVSVEIPSIPEDHEKVKICLAKMQKMGVKHLNIHQLHATEYNYKNYIDRGYTFLHYPNIPIFESEMAALRLIKYAVDKRIGLPINYCSCEYKNKFQGKGARQRKALLVKNDFEGLTNSKYIRRLSIQDSPANTKTIVKILQNNKCRHNLWSLNDTGTEIFIHDSLLKFIDFGKFDLTISYFTAGLKTFLGADESGKEIKLSSSNKIYIIKKPAAQQKLSGIAIIKSFQKLFIENMDDREAFNYLYRNYDLKTKESLNKMKKEIEDLKYLKRLERLEAGFPEIY